MKNTRLSAIHKALLLTALVLLVPDATRSEEKTITNRLGMEFRSIPAGTFIMGSPADDLLRDKGEVQHKVTISKSFYMQTTEVTLAHWRQLMDKGLFGFFKRRKGADNLPVTRICYHDIRTFIERLNAMGKERYRLPTEAEWEYAARAGTRTAYSWGDKIDCDKAMYANKKGRFDSCSGYAKKRGLPVNGPAPVKSFPPNPWGLYDMHGNVWEWCRDWYGSYAKGPQTDPRGPTQGTVRVRRGGSWFGEGYKCRSANRANGHPSSRLRSTGFRLVMIVQP